MLIGGLRELVRLVRPVTGRSVSFRLRFRFVRDVRAGEADLRRRMTIVVLIAGPPRSEYGGVSGILFASFLLQLVN